MASTGETWRLGHRPALDGLRGVAVVLVVVGHAIGVGGFGHRASAMGVTLFFVLSGFLITTLLLEEHDAVGRVALADFYWRRAVRLLPALIVFLAFVTLVLISAGALSRWWGSVGVTALYVANISKAAGVPFTPLGHTWSLAMEEQFYLVWPLVLVALLTLGVRRARLTLFLVGLTVVISAWRWWIWTSTGDELRTAWAPDTRADALLLGCAVGLVFSSGWLRVNKVLIGISWIGVAAMSTIAHGDWQWTWGLPVLEALSVVVLAGAVKQKQRFLEWLPLVRLGRVSYGLYLWHYVFMTWFATGVGLDRLTSVVLTLPVAGIFTWLSWRYVEVPTRRWGRSKSRNRAELRAAFRRSAARPHEVVGHSNA